MQTIGASRHGMFRHLFAVLFCLFLLICCAHGPAHAVTTVQGETVGVFLNGKTKVPERPGNEDPVKNVDYFYAPRLLIADGVMVAFAVADDTKNGNKNINLVARYIATGGEDWATKVINGSGDKWKTQLIMRKEENGTYLYELGKTASVVRNNKIYLLAVVYKREKCTFCLDFSRDWELVMIVGEIKDLAERDKTITWQKDEFLSSQLTKELKERFLDVMQSNWFAFLTKKGEVVFVVGSMKIGFFSAVFYSWRPGEPWELSHDETTKGCTLIRYFEWNGKIIRIMKCQYDGTRKVEESAGMGSQWSDAGDRFPGDWNKLDYTGNLTTATIEGKSVLLYTETTVRNDGTWWNQKTHYDVQLFATDGKRVHSAGKILQSDNRIIAGGLQYTKGELFFLYNQNEAPAGIRLAHLKDQLHNIKADVSRWDEEDRQIEEQTNPATPMEPQEEPWNNTSQPSSSNVNTPQPPLPEENTPQSPLPDENTPQSPLPEENTPQSPLPEENTPQSPLPEENTPQPAGPLDTSAHQCLDTTLPFLLGLWAVAVFW